jgi:succinyl-CoA synthetase alpha subunit
LKDRLAELDAEREQIIDELEKTNGTNGQKKKIRNYGTKSKILEVVGKAGPQGLIADEVFQAVNEALEQTVTRTTVSTYLSQLKNAGKLDCTGSLGSYRYFTNEVVD